MKSEESELPRPKGRGFLRVLRTSSNSWIRRLSFYLWLFVAENLSILERKIPRSQRVHAIGHQTGFFPGRKGASSLWCESINLYPVSLVSEIGFKQDYVF